MAVKLSPEDALARTKDSPPPKEKPSAAPKSSASPSFDNKPPRPGLASISKRKVILLLTILSLGFAWILFSEFTKRENVKTPVEDKLPTTGTATPEEFSGRAVYDPTPPVKMPPQQQLAQQVLPPPRPTPPDPEAKEREEKLKRKKDAMFAPSTIPLSAQSGKSSSKQPSRAGAVAPATSPDLAALSQSSQGLNALLQSLPGAGTANAATGPSSSSTFEEGTSIGVGGMGTGKNVDQNQQGEKRLFLIDKNGLAATTNSHKLQAPSSEYTLMAGAIIPAVLITGINSDLPGQIIAQVRENVFDTKTGQYLLIPQGARLLGKYDSVIAYGQDRALAVWQRLLFPNGKSISLDQMQGVDGMGQAGYEDQVDRHMLRIVGTAILSTIFSLGADAAKSSWEKNNTYINSSSSSSGSTSSQTDPSQTIKDTANKLVDKNINLQPTIRIRPGFSVNVLVNKDIILEPYSYQ